MLAEEDTDKKNQITVDNCSDKQFELHSITGKGYQITGNYSLANLLQELAITRNAGKDTLALTYKKINEPPVDGIARMIQNY